MSVYNGEKHLVEALDSIFSQTYKDIEIIVIDDCSTDSTPKILSMYEDKRLKIFKNKKNIGLALSLNKALDYSSGNYIARHDADDVSHPSRLFKQVEYMDRNPDVYLLGTSYMVIDSKGLVIGKGNTLYDDSEIKQQINKSSVFCHGSVLFRKEIFDKVGKYSNKSVAQDYDLWQRIVPKFKVGNLDDILYFYRYDSGKYPLKKMFMRASSVRSTMLMKERTIYNFFLLWFSCVGADCFSRGDTLAYLGNYNEACWLALKSVVFFPFKIKYWALLIKILLLAIGLKRQKSPVLEPYNAYLR